MAATDYSTYLRIDDLLTLRAPLTADADDELLFIVVHQAYELWFKVMLDELRRAATRLHGSEPWRAVAPLARTVDVGRLLLGHLAVLQTMSPEEFMRFRDPLNPASGFQSFQFRAIEFLSGAGDPRSLDFTFFDDRQRAWLAGVAGEPNVWTGFLVSLEAILGPGDVLERLGDLYHEHSNPSGPRCTRWSNGSSTTTRTSRPGGTATCSWRDARSVDGPAPAGAPAWPTLRRRSVSASTRRCGT
ncbi:MAG TPA: tryptophan 2,3-dioxygenase family protein [Acidimicrobiales bacterium]|nr:tryptophan 2,3-dioxygenase family protein [Acidimicrobiales bacterium]